DQVHAFEEALEFLDQGGINVLLVQTPCTKKHWMSFQNKDEIDDFFEAFVQKRLAGAYLNYNYLPEVGLNDSLDFYDTHHLNQNGVVKFNKILLENDVLKLAGHRRAPALHRNTGDKF